MAWLDDPWRKLPDIAKIFFMVLVPAIYNMEPKITNVSDSQK
jgi:hypothetical protein